MSVEDNQGYAIFRETLTELQRGLTAALITTRDLLCLDARCPVAEAEAIMAKMDISQVPVRRNGSIVGIYHQFTGSQDDVIDVHDVPVDDSLLTAMNASLLELLHRLAEGQPDFRLVVGQEGIEGIVTKSDLQKLPIRLLAYSLITHLESVMTNLIQAVCPLEDRWLMHLSIGNAELFPDHDVKSPEEWRNDLRGRQNGMRKGGIAPDLLDLTDFRHKYVILWKELSLPNEFPNDMKLINKWLRNTVAHSRSLPATTAHLKRFSTDLRATEYWTKYLEDILAESKRRDEARTLTAAD